MMLQITDANCKEVLSSNEYVVLDFGAAWCGPCRSLAPIIDKLAKEFEGKVVMGKVDIEESPETTDEFGIRNVPTIQFVRNGEVVPELKVVGAVPEAKIRASIEKLMA
ncbi:MAG: thioredoxin domain-containing protein [Paludibacteraceae bacterium]|nr:thioredoxin domain-containing protein [Paludibacteraceae bacterium]